MKTKETSPFKNFLDKKKISSESTKEQDIKGRTLIAEAILLSDKTSDILKSKAIDFFTKPNQKQFQQFDESLFKAYIDKFSNEDKLKMLAKLSCEISTVNPILNDLLNRISCYGGNK